MVVTHLSVTRLFHYACTKFHNKFGVEIVIKLKVKTLQRNGTHNLTFIINTK